MGRLSLKFVPRSSRDEIVGWLGDSLKVMVKAPPEKGRANEAVVALLAERLGTDASSIAVVSGHTSPAIDIHSLSPLPLARSRQSRRAAGLGETLRRSQKKATPGG